ncbi:MAG: peptide chain release factor N(5)-glutamine methyltransferase [Puniceicoccales bacterium]|jgi:release factor glutamine methyltransferase|nr:peptide chain release factor N(5)-glutamine methyltransferase [Puniceicoccales bacterium]
MASIIELLAEGVSVLRASDVEASRCDVEWLLAHVLGYSRLALNLNRQKTVDLKTERQFRELLLRRAKREPLQYILGKVDFCNVKLKVDARVFIPRGETEMLVEWLVNNMSKRMGNATCKGENFSPLNILDLGTGSGAIAIALAKCFPMGCVLAVDRSPLALEVARENMRYNGVNNLKLFQSDWYGVFAGDQWSERFDLIVSNPPYLTFQELNGAQDEVRRYEPISALVAEEDGLHDIRIILDGARKLLKKDGIVAVETGIAHPKQLQKEYEKYFRQTEILRDLNQFDRFFIAYR